MPRTMPKIMPKMMLPLFLAAVMLALVSFVSPAFSAVNEAVFTIGDDCFYLNGMRLEMTVCPLIKNGRTFLPIRDLARLIGVSDENIIWDSSCQKATIIKGDRIIQLTVGKDVLSLNGVSIKMDVTPEIVAGRLMLPLRVIAQSFGVDVYWDEAVGSIRVIIEDEEFVEDDADEATVGGYSAFDSSDSETIKKDYSWCDLGGKEWEWKLSIPIDLYEHFQNEPRIYEKNFNEFSEGLNDLKEEAEDLERQMEYWKEYYEIRPWDSYDAAGQKLQNYLKVYNELNQELARIRSEYQLLLLNYEEKQFQELLNGYVPYVTETANLTFIDQLAERLAESGPGDLLGRVQFAASFVQGAIPYVSEEEEYPKYAVETLVKGGDCEDKSILLAAILKAMGYKTALIGLYKNDPGHIAVGVNCPCCLGVYYEKNNVKYFYTETTCPNWRIGEVPEEHQGDNAYIYVVP